MSKEYLRLYRKKGLYLKRVEGKGRGVFCDSDIRRGEVIEVTPALLLNERVTSQVDRTMLVDYTFTAGRVSKELRERKGVRDTGKTSCMIFGVLTFCNHDDRPNAEVEWEEKDGTLYHTLKALRKIPKNTEICTSYGAGWFDDRK